MEPLAGPVWSEAVEQAAWIGGRLAPFGAHQVTPVVPGGFAAYARVLHPAEEPGWGDRLVRWAEVAAWSGTPLPPDAQFHTVALPPVRPEREAPWSSPGPRQGGLYPPDAEALAGLVREWTATPGRCWFCVWDGYGWDGGARRGWSALHGAGAARCGPAAAPTTGAVVGARGSSATPTGKGYVTRSVSISPTRS